MNRLAKLPKGSRIFVDSNILTYHILKDPVHGTICKQFIERIENEEVTGFVSPIVISETVYSFIKAYIVGKYGVNPRDVVSLLKIKPEIVREVNLDGVSELFEIFSILPVSNEEVIYAYSAIESYALLPNDAFHVAVMKKHGVRDIATNDRDFERVDWIKVWKP